MVTDAGGPGPVPSLPQQGYGAVGGFRECDATRRLTHHHPPYRLTTKRKRLAELLEA